MPLGVKGVLLLTDFTGGVFTGVDAGGEGFGELVELVALEVLEEEVELDNELAWGGGRTGHKRRPRRDLWLADMIVGAMRSSKRRA
jgi:hypothetical protein